MIDWRRLGIVVVVLSCGKSVPIEDKPCPCVEAQGFVCCVVTGRCVRAGAACGTAPNDAAVDSAPPGDAAADQGTADQRPPAGPNEPTTDKWTRMSAENGPDPADSAVWTGKEMIVWTGSTGARYDPAADRWTTMSTLRSPTPRILHSSVWTGKEMLVWGGLNGNTLLQSGGRYDPVTDSWTAMSVANAASPRTYHAAVWTGSQMVVWGGRAADGGRYDPVADRWSPISSVETPPSPSSPSAFWTGHELFFFGGYGPGEGYQGPLGLYDPARDVWRRITATGAPDARWHHAAVFTGKEVIVWGGRHEQPVGSGLSEDVANGAAYDVAAGSWRPLSITDSPGPSTGALAVWADGAGTQGTGLMLVIGAGVYDPPSNKWWTMSRQSAPSSASVAVWTGQELLVWVNDENTGADPVTKAGWRYRP